MSTLLKSSLFSLLASITGLAAEPLEMSGYFRVGNDEFFTLYETETKVTSGWVAVGTTFRGYELSSYDRSNGVLTVRRDSDSFYLRVRESALSIESTEEPDLDLSEQLRVEEETLATLKKRYTDKHPRVRAQSRKLEVLRSPLKLGESVRRRVAEAELARLRQNFTEAHPLVKKQIEKIAALTK